MQATQRGADDSLIGLWVLVGILVLLGGLAILWTATTVPLAALFRPWYLARAAGFIALLLLWASVVIGLAQSLGLLKGITGPKANLDVHEYVSVFSLYATAFHALVMMFDHPNYALTPAQVFVPFAAGQHPVLMALGIIATYLFLGVVISTYFRAKLNPKLWRAIHLSSLVGFLMAMAHSIFLGSDSSSPFGVGVYLFTGVSVLILTGYRIYRSVAKA